MEYAKVAPAVRKGKKKQVKDELDRIKQAERKKRRLEKALATSAVIHSELEKEKQKQKKKEEQRRLDEQGIMEHPWLNLKLKSGRSLSLFKI